MIVAIDFETANSDRKSVVSVGIAFRKNNQIFSHEWLIKPPDNTEFNEYNVNIHHITPDMVKDMPYFPVIWQQIEQIIGEEPIFVAHNAQSVEGCCLRSLFTHYKMGAFNPQIICTLDMSRKYFPQISSCGLATMTRWFEIDLTNHHNAEEDAKACLELYESLQCPEKITSLYDRIMRYYVENYFFKISEHNTRDELNELLRNSVEKIIDMPDCRFADMNIVFSGELDFKGSKDFVRSLINRFGANYKTSVSRKTDILILSPYFYELSTKKKYVSTKYKEACEIQEKGGKIKIISWSEFLKMCSMPHIQ